MKAVVEGLKTVIRKTAEVAERPLRQTSGTLEDVGKVQGGIDRELSKEVRNGRSDTGTDPKRTGTVLENAGVESRTPGKGTTSHRGEVDGRGNSHGEDIRVLKFGDREIRPVAKHTLPKEYAAFLRKHGRSTPDIYELDPADADYFQAQMQALKDSSRYSASVNVHSLEEYRKMRLFVTDDGKAGGALRGDELLSLWAHKDGRYPHVSSALLGVRVSLGGRILNCFDTVLPDLYAFCGFKPVARLPWDDRFAPEGWDYDTYRKYNDGRPDVVFMTYAPDALGSRYEPGSGRIVDSYDAGIAAAREAAE